jgi:hypothetical protein
MAMTRCRVAIRPDADTIREGTCKFRGSSRPIESMIKRLRERIDLIGVTAGGKAAWRNSSSQGVLRGKKNRSGFDARVWHSL